MKNNDITNDELKEQKDIECFETYCRYAKMVIKRPEGERYTMLDNLCKMMENEYSYWLGFKDNLSFSSLWMYVTNLIPYKFNIDTFIELICAKKLAFNPYIYSGFPMINDDIIQKSGITQTILSIMMLYGALHVALEVEEEWLWLNGKTDIPPKRKPYKFPIENSMQLEKEALDKAKDFYSPISDITESSEQDKELNYRILHYNVIARKLINNPSVDERIPSLKNLLTVIEDNNPTIINKNYSMIVRLQDLDAFEKNKEIIGAPDYSIYQSIFYRGTNYLTYDFKIINKEGKPKSITELELLFLYCSLKTELNNYLEEASLYGKSNNSKPQSGVIINHFSMSVETDKLIKVLNALKHEGWVSDDTKENNWVFRLTGRSIDDTAPSNEPIMFKSNNICRYIVKNFIFKDKKVSSTNWMKVKQIFKVQNGDINNIMNANKTPSGSDIIDKIIDLG